MIIVKSICTSIDLKNPNDIYSPNINDVIIKILKAKYENKCFSSMLITKIIKIIKKSDIKFNKNLLDGSAYIDVQFSVEGIIFIKGEIVHGCTITSIAQQNKFFSHPHITGLINGSNDAIGKTLIQSQVIPVIIENVAYNINKNTVTAHCLPFSPKPFPKVFFNITKDAIVENIKLMEKSLSDLKTEQNKHNQLSTTKQYAAFKSLIYPYKTEQKFEMSPLGMEFKPLDLSVQNLIKIKDGTVTSQDLASQKFILYNEKPIDIIKDIDIIDCDITHAVIMIVREEIMYLYNLRGFVEYYTVEKNRDMMPYWEICSKLKI